MPGTDVPFRVGAGSKPAYDDLRMSAGLIRSEVTDGDTLAYRGNLFYDLAEERRIIRLRPRDGGFETRPLRRLADALFRFRVGAGSKPAYGDWRMSAWMFRALV